MTQISYKSYNCKILILLIIKLRKTQTSKRIPSFILHKYTSKKSWPPAAKNSSLASSAKQENCTGRGEVRVRKFLYLAKSYARIVPSNEADAINLRL